MKVLILSSDNGGGHNAVAGAIKECFEAHGDRVAIRDGLSFLAEILPDIVSRYHNFMYRHMPRVFDRSYRRSENKPELFKERHLARSAIDMGNFALGRYIRSEGFGTVICTHVFPAMMLSTAVRRYGLELRTAIVETDHVNTPGSANNDMDYHFLPDADLVPGLIAAGVPEERIVVSGIPVRREIYESVSKEEARRRLRLDLSLPHILIMGGRMGCGPFPEIIEALCGRLGGRVQISAVCGSNERMRRNLSEEYGERPDVRIMGYVGNVSLLYDSADIVMTKPGGVTTAEAAVKGLPMVLINAVAGCEAHNLRFFLDSGCAVTGETPEELCEACGLLLKDKTRYRRVTDAFSGLDRSSAAELIYTTLTEGK